MGISGLGWKQTQNNNQQRQQQKTLSHSQLFPEQFYVKMIVNLYIYIYKYTNEHIVGEQFLSSKGKRWGFESSSSHLNCARALAGWLVVFSWMILLALNTTS